MQHSSLLGPFIKFTLKQSVLASNVITLSLPLIVNTNKLERLSVAIIFQPSLIFVGKTVRRRQVRFHLSV